MFVENLPDNSKSPWPRVRDWNLVHSSKCCVWICVCSLVCVWPYEKGILCVDILYNRFRSDLQIRIKKKKTSSNTNISDEKWTSCINMRENSNETPRSKQGEEEKVKQGNTPLLQLVLSKNVLLEVGSDRGRFFSPQTNCYGVCLKAYQDRLLNQVSVHLPELTATKRVNGI